jgi:hypothetical protein
VIVNEHEMLADGQFTPALEDLRVFHAAGNDTHVKAGEVYGLCG